MTKDLEYKLLYSIVVAGKSASFAENAMRRLYDHLVERDYWRGNWKGALLTAYNMGAVMNAVKASRLGNYTKCSRAIVDFIFWPYDLQTCTAKELELIHGIRYKTSRFFLRWSDRRERYAVLDTHILKWLASKGHNVQLKTPQSWKRYQAVTDLFLAEADALGVHPVDLDRELWLRMNTSGIRE